MFLILKLIFKELDGHIQNVGSDPRTTHLPLVNGYSKILPVQIGYLLIVLKILPKYMKKREPFKLKRVMQAYNIFQILMNIYIYCGLTKNFFFHPLYKWSCMTYDRTDTSPATLNLIHYGYLYFLNKIIDLLDTIFFVLRKKYNQVSFLHVYHHVAMIYATFIYHSIGLASQFTVVGHVNSLIHILMYLYYFLAALDTNINLKAWKPRMTELQILQFTYMSIKLAVPLWNNWCGVPMFWLIVLFIQNLFMLAMFSHFYWKTYIVKNPKSLKPKERTSAKKL